MSAPRQPSVNVSKPTPGIASQLEGVATPVPMNAASAITLRMMREGGQQYVPPLPAGNLWRPTMTTSRGGLRAGGPETFYDYFINVIPNADWTTSYDANFDEKVANYPDVAASMRKRALTVATFPLAVNSSTARNLDKALGQQFADYVKEVLKSLPNFCETTRQLVQGGTLYGGRGCECVWSGDANGVERPVETWDVHGSRMGFDTMNNLTLFTRETPMWGSYIGSNPQQVSSSDPSLKGFTPPPGRFLFYKYMAEGGAWYRPAFEGFNYHGRGENTRLYLPVSCAYYMWRFEMKFAEKHGMPTTVVWYTENQAQTSQSQAIGTSLRDEAVVFIPMAGGAEGKNMFYDLDFVQPSSMGYDLFQSFHERVRTEIEKILLGGANLMQLADVGGYNASEGQRDAGEQIIFMYDAMCISAMYNLQLVPHIIWAVPQWRNIPLEWMPKVDLMPHKLRNRLQELQILQQAAQMVPVREADVYDAAGLSKPNLGLDGSEPEPTIFLGQPQADLFNGFPTPAGTSGAASVEDPVSVQQQLAQLRQAAEKSQQINPNLTNDVTRKSR